ncbi:unnamed protein product [Alternaria burnsii]|nr:unnamed protein product [Alternaria burnsii]
MFTKDMSRILRIVSNFKKLPWTPKSETPKLADFKIQRLIDIMRPTAAEKNCCFGFEKFATVLRCAQLSVSTTVAFLRPVR